MSPLKTLRFDRQSFALVDSEQVSFPLSGAHSPEALWSLIPWGEAEMGQIELGDLPCRLETPSLGLCFKSIWKISGEGARVTVRVPHPRHDDFLRDLGYVRGLLPESFTELDRALSVTGLAHRLGVQFKHIETALTLDPQWQKTVNDGKLKYEDVQAIAKQNSNVIQWIGVQMQITKSPWVQTLPGKLLTSEMEKQLLTQIEALEARGDLQAAETIRQFLIKEGRPV